MSSFINTGGNQKGFTLVEILITIIVLSIGLLGLAGLQISGLRANMSSEARSKATVLANDIAERMRTNTLGVHNDDADADNQYADISTANLNCNTLPAALRSGSRWWCSGENGTRPLRAMQNLRIWRELRDEKTLDVE